MFGKILFNKLTPYNRSFIHITLKSGRPIMLPAINSAVFFLTNRDMITINDLDMVTKLPFLDYQLIEADKTFKEEMDSFRHYVKDKIYEKNFADLTVYNKQIINNDVYIILEEGEFERATTAQERQEKTEEGDIAK